MPKTATNPQHAAFPALFKRTGEARRIKGFRTSRELFSKAIRLAKALEGAPRLAIMTPIGLTILSEQASTLIKQDGGVESLMLNGFEFYVAHDGMELSHADIDGFLNAHNMIKGEDLLTQDMFSDEE